MIKIITSMEYAKLKDKEKVANRLQNDLYGSLSFEQQAEILLKIGKDDLSGSYEDRKTIYDIGCKWMNDICWAYNNTPYKPDGK